ncbi:hypothetical protein ACNRC9_11100, partial [Ralstonia pseudosolanacearum]|uniref:hypothetical protein n=1 Tax=Ralstonia pseudosolanacearum TaxID=1310165 RepID=UPI003AAF9785
MTQINKHGLRRTIPEDIKRQIRQRCGFGCVICGLAFYDYEHFDPDFVDATEHNPAGMTLLCSQCNQKRARTRLSAETVAAANANPKCRQQGFSSEWFDFSSDPIEIVFAGVTFYDCRYLIVVNGRPLLGVEPPIEPGQPVRLSGLFTDASGKVTLRIRDNAFSVDAKNWDVECVGPRITVRSAQGAISLVLTMAPPSRLIVERLEMQFQGAHFRGTKDLLEISPNGTGWHRWQGSHVRSCRVGIAIDNVP